MQMSSPSFVIVDYKMVELVDAFRRASCSVATESNSHAQSFHNLIPIWTDFGDKNADLSGVLSLSLVVVIMHFDCCCNMLFGNVHLPIILYVELLSLRCTEANVMLHRFSIDRFQFDPPGIQLV